ncbi:MAG: hypothetical protein ACKOX3_08770 [Bacteroidota bacterium]
MKYTFYILLPFVILFNSSCTKETPTSSIKLFNTNGLIRSNIVTLQKNNARLLKTAEYNGRKEVVQLDTVNWNKELEIITASNLSEKSLSYKADTICRGNDSIITYTAKEAKLDVRKMTLLKNNGAIRKISIERMKENAFYYSIQEIEYVPQFYFSIYSKEKMILSDTTYYRITGVIN